MIRRVIKKGDDYLRRACDSISPKRRRWVVIAMTALFAAGVVYNLITEFIL